VRPDSGAAKDRPVNTTTVDTTDDAACPYCGETSGVQAMPAPPKVQAWECKLCRTQWAVSRVNPHLRSAYLADLVAAVEEIGRLRWALRQIIALAEQAPTITDELELRTRLVALADRARLVQPS
jgi:ribosomal protein L37AE/L43A